MPRVIFDLPADVQMAIRLRAIKSGQTTGGVIAEAVALTIPQELEEALAIKKEPNDQAHMSDQARR